MRTGKWLLLTLLLQVSAWLYLWTVYPHWDDDLTSAARWLNEDRTAWSLDQSFPWYDPPRTQFLQFDLVNRRWKWLTRREMIREYDNELTGMALWELKSPSRGNHNYLAEQFDRTSLETLVTREIAPPQEIDPSHFRPEISGNRFVLSLLGNRLDYLDLEDPHSKFQSIDILTFGATESHEVHSSADGWILMESSPMSNRTGMPSQLDLFRMADGLLRLERTWDTRFSGNTIYWHGYLVTVPMNVDEVEFQSPVTGEVLRRFDFSSRFQSDQVLEVLNWPSGPVIKYFTSAGPKYFDVLRERTIEQLTARELVDGLPDGSMQVCMDLQGAHIIDLDKDRELFQLPFSYYSLTLLNQKTLLYVTRDYGVSFHFYDAQSGRYQSSYRPFALVIWLSVALVVGFAVWAVLWMRHSRRAGWSPWLDVTLVLWLPWCMMRLYAASMRSSAVYPISVMEYGIGISMAALALAVAWAIHRPGSLWSRLRPLVLLEICNAVWWTALPHQHASWFMNFLVLQHMPLLFVACYLQVTRMLSLAFSKGDRLGASHPTSHIELQDFFVLTFCIAAMLGAYKWISPSVYGQLNAVGLDLPWGFALVIIVMLSLGRASNRFLLGAGVVLTSVCLGAWLADCIVRWTLDARLDHHGRYVHFCRVSVPLAAGAFVGCLPLRRYADRTKRLSGHTSVEKQSET